MALVYRHIRLDTGKPFYIGIGNKINRAYDKRGRSDYWKRIANKHGYEVQIMVDDLTYEEAKLKEKELIKLYGRDNNGGLLCNRTEGGDGTVGIIVSEKTRKKLSEINTGKKRTKESIIKSANSNRGQKRNNEVRKRMSKAQKGRIISEETRKKMSESRRGRIISPEIIKKIADANRGQKRSEEVRKRMSDIQRAGTLSEEGKKRLSEAQKGRKATEEARKKMSESRKGRVLSEETKRKVSEGLKKHHFEKSKNNRIVYE